MSRVFAEDDNLVPLVTKPRRHGAEAAPSLPQPSGAGVASEPRGTYVLSERLAYFFAAS